MPTVFASVSATIILFFLATMGMAYGHVLPVNLHMLWGFFVATLIVLLQCLIFGFFIGSGKSIKRVVADNNLGPYWVQKTKDYKNKCYPALMLAIVISAAAAIFGGGGASGAIPLWGLPILGPYWVQKTKDYKNKCYPALMLAIVISAAAAILGGGVASGAIPLWVHEVFVWLALAANARSLWISYKVVVENVNAIHLINAEVKTRKNEGRSIIEPALREPDELVVNRPPPSQASKYYFLAVAAWVPYLYVKVSLSSRNFPFWHFLGLSGVLVFWGFWENRKTL